MEASGCMFLLTQLYTELSLLAWRRRRVLPAACTVLPDFVCGFLVEKELEFHFWLTKKLRLPGGGGVSSSSQQHVQVGGLGGAIEKPLECCVPTLVEWRDLFYKEKVWLPGGGGGCCASSVSRSAASGVRSRDSGTRAAAS